MISKNRLFFSNWYKRGIYSVSDIVDDNGQVLSQENIIQKFNVTGLHFLQYFQIRDTINTFIRSYRTGDNFAISCPYIPHHIKILYNSNKGGKNFYIRLNKKRGTRNYKKKWTDYLNVTENDDMWRTIFKACFKVVQDNDLIWFQYRVIHRILGVRKYLYMIKESNSPLCRLCGQEEENIIHLFYNCQYTISLWQDLITWICNTSNITLDLNASTIILGYSSADNLFRPINTVLMVSKYYIFQCCYNSARPNIFTLQKRIKKVYQEQKLVAQLNNRYDHFEQHWQMFGNMFNNI